MKKNKTLEEELRLAKKERDQLLAILEMYSYFSKDYRREYIRVTKTFD